MPSEIENNGTIGTANLLTTNVPMTGQSATPSDIDFFKLYSSGSGTAQFSLTLPSNNLSHYYGKIYDALGTLQKSYTTTDSATYSVASTSAGYFYISVNSNSTADYSINGSFNADKTDTNPTYLLRSDITTVNEGSEATFTLTIKNVATGTSVPYALSGISAEDVSGGSLSGNAVINSSGEATISVTLLNDLLTEGSEILAVTAGGAGASTVVIDTSVSATIPIYTLTTSTSSVNEGSAAIFTLATTNVVAGTAVPYSLSGISYLDVLGWGAPPMGGIFVVDSIGRATISIGIASDNLTEGSESLTFTVQGTTASTVIADTSTTLKPTYSLIPAATSVNEGDLARVFVNTTNVIAGTLLYYSVTGVSSDDIIGGLTRQVSVDALGQAFINLLTVADQTTEGTETMFVTLGSSTISLLINDTSITLVGVIDTSGGGGGGD